MTPYHASERAIFYNGDCRVVMEEMEENSVDSIVCDPPYELGFMGKTWDKSGIAYDMGMWRECLRVLKPGGHLLAFGGSRTYHRLACSVEDAGFEIRDQIMWVYGSGFPKSLDVSKAIDKAAGAERVVVGKRTDGRYAYEFSEAANRPVGGQVGTEDAYRIGGFVSTERGQITAPATPEAKKWDGWGTALKPAHEPIVVARKPLIGTVVANVLKHGTGAMNIGACRIEGEDVPINRLENWSGFGQEKRPDYEQEINTSGRWPANLIHDGSDEVLALFPTTSPSPLSNSEEEYRPNNKNQVFGEGMGGGWHSGFGDEGSAARFFYCAKASGDDRDEGLSRFEKRAKKSYEGGRIVSADHPETAMGGESLRSNHHPTVKPKALMRYLCRLVTPPGGTVLDPFMGSGSTYKAAYQEGFNFVGIEIHEPYCAIAINRIAQNIIDFGA